MSDSAIDIHEVLEYLPHRYPFLLIDKVIELDPGKSLHAVKNVTMNEPHFTGHFPDHPVMPGVLILEAMAQAACVFAYKSTNKKPDGKSIYFFAGIDNARFKRVVEPGDTLHLYIELEKGRRDMWVVKARAEVEEKIVCTATLMSMKKEIKSDT